VIAAIAANDLSRRIALPGELAPPLLREHYLGADLFVLPSLFEGYGMVVSEAVAHGLPVLATHGGALAETLPAGAGVLVPPGDAAALARALQVLLRDTGARARLREGARRARANLRDWHHAAGVRDHPGVRCEHATRARPTPTAASTGLLTRERRCRCPRPELTELAGAWLSQPRTSLSASIGAGAARTALPSAAPARP
jgi:hypothetical protein